MPRNMKVAGLVAVRRKSSRLKDKALLDLNGKPLILRLLLRLKKSRKMDDIVLCTTTLPEDQLLVKIASENGFKSFAGSEEDVMDRFIQTGEREEADIIIRITGDNPLTDPGIIDLMVQEHTKSSSDYTRMDNLPSGITSEVITFSALKKAFKLAEESKNSEYMTWYFTKNPGVFKLNVLQPEDALKRPQYRLTVDYPEDYELMKQIFHHFKNKQDFTIKEVINFLDDNPDIAGINAQVSRQQVDFSINTKLRVA